MHLHLKLNMKDSCKPMPNTKSIPSHDVVDNQVLGGQTLLRSYFPVNEWTVGWTWGAFNTTLDHAHALESVSNNYVQFFL